MNENTITRLKRRSKDYKKYILDVINDYNTNGKKTVLLTCDSYFPTVDGVINVVDNYAKELSKVMNVMLLTSDFKGDVYTNGYPAIGIASMYSKKLQYQIPLPMLSNDYKHYLKKLRIDIIHCHSPFTVSRIAMRLHKQRKIPLVSTFHSLSKYDFQRYAKPFVNFMMKYILKCYNSSDEVWSMNQKCIDALHEYGYQGKTFIIPHGTVPHLSGNYAEMRSFTRKKYNVDDNGLFFIFVGRLIVHKNVHFIVDVLSELKEKGLDFKMLFVGDGPEKQRLAKHITKNGLDSQVEIVDNIHDINGLDPIYAAADMLLFPSYYDTFALVKIEAAYQNTPTAFIENCPAGSRIKHGENGFVFEHDVQKYASGVYEAVKDREYLKTVGENAHRDLYVTWQDIVPKVYDRYLYIIDESNKAKINK